MSQDSDSRRIKFSLSTFLLITLVVESQYIIDGWVFNYGNNKDVINYVSFAGTIVSIILAVLAIVYSYYQNFSQQRDAYNIASQIDNLREAVGRAENSGRGFSDAISRLKEISLKIDKNISLGEASHALLRGIRESNSEKRDVLSSASGGADPKPGELATIAKRLVRLAALNQLTSYYLIVKGAEVKLSLKDMKAKAIETAFPGKSKNYYSGFMQCSAYMLLDLRLIALADQDPETPFAVGYVDDEFKRSVIDTFERYDKAKAQESGVDIDKVIAIFAR